MQLGRTLGALSIALSLARLAGAQAGAPVQLSERETLEARGLSVLLYHNTYHPTFADQKLSGLELILHGRRIATNGDVRLPRDAGAVGPDPEAHEARRRTGRGLAAGRPLLLRAPHDFDYRIERDAGGGRPARGRSTSPTPLPERARWARRGSTSSSCRPPTSESPTLVDGRSSASSRATRTGPCEVTAGGRAEPRPLATGQDAGARARGPAHAECTIASESGAPDALRRPQQAPRTGGSWCGR